MFRYQKVWDPLHLKPAQTLDLQLGALHLWIHRGKEEWYIAHEYEPGSDDRLQLSVSDAPFPKDRPWTRWILHNKIDQIRLQPQLPNRPIIVRPEMPVCLMPNQSARFFVGIPIWLRITFGSQKENLVEIPTMILSNSWFGSVTEGELCYALKTTAKRDVGDLLPAPNRVVFPLEIRNLSNENLAFERLCLRSQHLNIYEGAKRLWSSHGRISYRGAEKWSRFVYSSQAPEMDHAAKLLSEARAPTQRGLILNTFDNIKNLTES